MSRAVEISRKWQVAQMGFREKKSRANDMSPAQQLDCYKYPPLKLYGQEKRNFQLVA